MKPFNLEEVLRTGKAVTRDGRLVTDISYNKGFHSVFARIENSATRCEFSVEGRFLKKSDHDFDLFCLSEPEEKEGGIIDLLKELKLQLNYACYDENVMNRLKNTWDAYYKLEAKLTKV